MKKETPPLVTNEDLGTNMGVYEASLERHTSHDVTMRLNMTAAYGAGARNMRDIYEKERSALIREMDEAVRLVRQSEYVLIEARAYVDAHRDNVRGEYITDTWDEDVERSVSNINATLGSISTFLSTQTPTDQHLSDEAYMETKAERFKRSEWGKMTSEEIDKMLNDLRS